MFDNRGVGRSGKPDIPYTIRMMANDTICLLNNRGIEQVHVFAISMGAMITQEIAAQSANRIKSLILNVAFTRIQLSSRIIERIIRAIPPMKKNG